MTSISLSGSGRLDIVEMLSKYMSSRGALEVLWNYRRVDAVLVDCGKESTTVDSKSVVDC